MYFIKRMFVYVLIILLFISIYHDLERKAQTPKVNYAEDIQHHTTMNYTIMHIKVQPGDTILSIVEQLNDNKFQRLDIEQIVTDFQALNPTVDPYHLEPQSFYFFPKY